MSLLASSLPDIPALVRVRDSSGVARLALWRRKALLNLTVAPDSRLHTLDSLLALPIDELRRIVDDPDLDSLPPLSLEECSVLAPVEGQEVWAAGVTYLRSREARMEEAVTSDIYAMVYAAERPEIFFKAAGWRVVAHDGKIGIRPDSTWDVPEPELAVLSNAAGEVVAYSLGNDMSSRSIEGENPLYLPQAKVYDASCSIGPVAVLAWHMGPPETTISMQIERRGDVVFTGSARTVDMVRDPTDLVRVVHSAYTLPVGCWLLTGTSIVPPLPYTASEGDIVTVSIQGIGLLRNTVRCLTGPVATAPPRLPSSDETSR